MPILRGNVGNKIEAGDIGRKRAMRLRPRGEVVSHVIYRDAFCFKCIMVEVVRRAVTGDVAGATYSVDKI